MSKLDELYERVCQKLEAESDGDAARITIAAYVRERVREDVDGCMAVLADDKTLAGAYGAIKEEARKRWEKDRKQEGVCITQEEATPLIDAYYGLREKQATPTDDEKPQGKVVSLFDIW